MLDISASALCDVTPLPQSLAKLRLTPSYRLGLRAAILEKKARIGIIGMGYVGLPLARAFVDKGVPAVGFDVDAAKVAQLNRGESYIGHIPDAVIAEMRCHGRFEATDQMERFGDMDAIII